MAQWLCPLTWVPDTLSRGEVQGTMWGLSSAAPVSAMVAIPTKPLRWSIYLWLMRTHIPTARACWEKWGLVSNASAPGTWLDTGGHCAWMGRLRVVSVRQLVQQWLPEVG